jgi:hypothetical protein
VLTRIDKFDWSEMKSVAAGVRTRALSRRVKRVKVRRSDFINEPGKQASVTRVVTGTVNQGSG